MTILAFGPGSFLLVENIRGLREVAELGFSYLLPSSQERKEWYVGNIKVFKGRLGHSSGFMEPLLLLIYHFGSSYVTVKNTQPSNQK